MKILLPFQDPFNRTLDSKIMSGGTENFCKSIYENFETIPHYIPIEQIKWNQRQKKEEAQKIVDKAEEEQVDVIVSNFAQAIYNSQTLIKSKVPIMFVEHCIYPIPNVIYRWNQGIKNGHSLFWVSEWQQKKYEDMAKRTNQSVIRHAGYVRPGYVKVKQKLPKKYKYECGTIGRCDNGKKPFLLKQLLKDTDMKSLVITSTTQFEKDKPYYERNKKWSDVTWNDPYSKVIKKISECKTYFSTWEGETYGLTSLEALSCGVPVILNSDKDGIHASTIIPASKEHYKVIPNKSKEELVKAIKSFENVDRKAIQEATWEKHNREAWKKQFENCVDKTIENFKKKS